MIERQTINGRDAYVVYLDRDLAPVDKAEATLVKVIYKDTGETMWLVPPDTDEDKDA